VRLSSLTARGLDPRSSFSTIGLLGRSGEPMNIVRFVAAECALTILLPASAIAAPTYLQCSFIKDGKTVILSVTPDEDSGSVTTLVENTGHSERQTAVFSPTSVRWNSPMSFGGLRYALSRTDLTIVRDLVIGDKTFTDNGTCKLQKAPERKF
jgi:hypothetical protein